MPKDKRKKPIQLAPYVFSFSAGYYRGHSFNTISARRKKNKVARRQRRVNIKRSRLW